MKVTRKVIQFLKRVYGKDATLDEINDIVISERPYSCPKCNESGQIEYNCYPTRLPDSGCVYEAGYKDCNLCDGYGYTGQKMKAKTEIIGYEKE